MDELPSFKDLEMFSTTAIVELKSDYSEVGHKEIINLPKGTKGWTTFVWGKVDSEWITDRMAHPIFGSNRVPFYWMNGGKSDRILLEYENLKIVKKLSAWREVAKNGGDFRSKEEVFGE